jgi:hypothetical protein
VKTVQAEIDVLINALQRTINYLEKYGLGTQSLKIAKSAVARAEKLKAEQFFPRLAQDHEISRCSK